MIATGGQAGRILGAWIALGLVALLFSAASAGAATIVPDVLTDDFTPDAECSLREAVQVANLDDPAVEDDCAVTGTFGADTVTLSSGTYQLGPDDAFDEDASPDDNAQGDIDIDGPLTIEGQGAGVTTINAAAIMPPVRGLHFLNSNGAVALEDLRVTGGHPVGAVSGGGVLVESATDLTMLRTTINTNSAQFGGGVSASDLTVTDSTISNNNATNSGGGIRASGELVVNGTTTVTGNSALSGGGIAYSAGSEPIAISGGVTVSDNTAITSVGGGLSVVAQGGTTTTISGATFDGNTAAGGGGAVFFDAIGAESVSFTNVTVQDNDAESNGGGLLLQDDASITGSEITGNTARELVDDGIAEGFGGGGVYAAGDLFVEDTWIDQNEASSADPNDSLTGGGILNGFGQATIRGSTISNNETAGGQFAGGAGIAASSTSTTRVENSTLSGNVANGAGSQGGAVFQSPATTTMVVAQSTLAGNSAVTAPAILNNGSLTLSGSILAGGVAGCGGVGTTTANAYNLDFGTTCVGAANDTDLESTNPQLGALGPNGGPTLTMAPIPASPAVDAVPSAACRDALGAPLALDQRGLGRPDDGNGDGQYDCEAGAVELQVSGPKPAVPGPGQPATKTANKKKCKKAKKKKKRANGAAKKRKKKKCRKKKKKRKRIG